MKTILFSGGITLGSVSPLVATIQYIKKNKPEWRVVFVGTSFGPERELLEKNNVEFLTIRAAKLRRYFSIHNLVDIFNFFIAVVQSFYIIFKQKPACLVSAGSSISVPLHWVAKFFGVPTVIHQQDVRPGLANILMAHTAAKITVALEGSTKHFQDHKTVWIGNPVREEFSANKIAARNYFKIPQEEKVILVLGGGTGSLQINRLIERDLSELTKFARVMHITGKEKFKEAQEIAKTNHKYIPFEFIINEMPQALAAADLVITRAGFSTLSELSATGTPSILVPIQNSHQEENAKYFARLGAAVLPGAHELTTSRFAPFVESVLTNNDELNKISEAVKNILPTNSASKLAEAIESVLK